MNEILDSINSANFIISAVMTIEGFVLFAIAHHHNQPRKYQIFLACWSLGLLSSIFMFYLIKILLHADPSLWVGTLIDIPGRVLFGMGGYILLQGDGKLTGGLIVKAACVVAILFVFVIALGMGSHVESIYWKLVFISPDLLVSAGALVLIAIAIVQEEKFSFVRWPAFLCS